MPQAKVTDRCHRIVLLAALCWLISGCGKVPNTLKVSKSSSINAASKSPTAKSKAQLLDVDEPLARLRTSHVSRSDPNAEDWQSEEFGRRAQEQLEQLIEPLTGDGAIKTSDLHPLLADGFRCRAPESNLESVFQDATFRVQRPADKGIRDRHDAAGLAQMLSQLRAALDPESSTARCKFKTFRVTRTENATTTTAHWDYLIESETSAVQQTGNWVCQWQSSVNDQPPKLQSIEITDYERVTRMQAEPVFSDCTESVLGNNDSYHQQLAFGLDHWLQRLPLYNGIVATSYHGLAVGDANGDGLDDVYVCQPGGVAGGLPNRLFLQQPDGSALDASAASGVDWLTESHAALFADVDNDADQDLIVATIAGLILAENDGAGRYTARVLKLLPEAPPMSLAAADFDNDGDLDIYACCYAKRSIAGTGRPLPYHDANNGSRNILLRNDRQWSFKDVAQQVGLGQNNRRFSFACAWEDFDNDGDQDLYVANDFGRNNLYRNDHGHFSDIAENAGVEDMSAGMSVTWGDANNDGLMDLYVSNMWSSAGNRIAYQSRFLPSGRNSETLRSFQRHARGNSLFVNATQPGVHRFHDVSTEAHVTIGGWAWSSLFADINNDGWQDLLVANGYITQDDKRDL